MDDARLLEQFATGGSHQAFEALVSRYGPMVRAAAGRYLRDSHLADDVAQGVFTALARKASRLDGRLLPAWLLRATYYGATAMLRAESRRRKHERQAAVVDRDETSASRDDSEAMSMVDAALLRLSDIDRAAVVLRYLRELSFTQVGEVLGIGEEAARKRVTRAIDRLKAHTLRASAAGAMSISTEKLLSATLHGGSIDATGIAVAAIAKSASAASAGVVASGVVGGFAWVQLKLLAGALLGVVALSTVAATAIHLYLPSREARVGNSAAARPPTLAQMAVYGLPDAPELDSLMTVSLLDAGRPVLLAGGSNQADVFLCTVDAQTGQVTPAVIGRGATERTSGAAITPDGSRVVFAVIDERDWTRPTLSERRHRVMWAPLGGQPGGAAARELHRDKNQWVRLTIAADGSIAASAPDGASRVRAWSLPDGAQIAQIDIGAPISSLAIDGVGRRLMVGDTKGSIHLRQLDSPADSGTLLTGHTNAVTSFALWPRGHLLASGDADGAVLVWDIRSSPPRFLNRFEGHVQPIRSLAFSADGKTLLSAPGRGVLSPHALLQLVPDEPGICVWDIEASVQIAQSRPLESAAVAAILNGDGSQAFAYLPGGQVQVLSVPPTDPRAIARTLPPRPTDGQEASISNPFGPFAYGMLPEGAERLFEPGDTLAGWADRAGKLLTGRGEFTGYAVQYSPDTGAILRLGRGQFVDRLSDGTTAFSLPSDDPRVSLRRDRLASITAREGGECELVVRGVPSGQVISRCVLDKRHFVRAIGFSPDAATVFCGWSIGGGAYQAECGVDEIDAATGTLVRTLEAAATGSVQQVLATPDGRQLIAIIETHTFSTSIARWELGSGRRLPTIAMSSSMNFPAMPPNPLIAAAVSPDSTLLAVGDELSNVNVINLATGRLVRRMRLHEDRVLAVRFTPDGKRILSASLDGTLRLWKLD